MMKNMHRSKNGTWVVAVSGDLKGKFYTFQVKIGEKWLNETPGMWVKAVGINGKRAAIIDFNETNPEGWEKDKRPELKNVADIALYELHVRDFSMSPNSGMKNKGKFLAFTEQGTKNTAGQATGIDHLKELGITHVHLLPSLAQSGCTGRTHPEYVRRLIHARNRPRFSCPADDDGTASGTSTHQNS